MSKDNEILEKFSQRVPAFLQGLSEDIRRDYTLRAKHTEDLVALLKDAIEEGRQDVWAELNNRPSQGSRPSTPAESLPPGTRVSHKNSKQVGTVVSVPSVRVRVDGADASATFKWLVRNITVVPSKGGSHE